MGTVSHWVLLLGLAVVSEGLVLQRTLLKDTEAKCSAGAQAGYYYQRTNVSGFETKLHIMMINSDEDFLWCFPPGRENLTKTLGGCAVGAGKVGTTPTPIPPNLTVPDLGIPSRNCSSNPVLCNYHKVVIQSCEHANWMGDSYHEAGGMYVYFRGHRILNSTIAQIASDFALNESFSVVITGLTGGGNALYTYADRIGDYLRDTAGVTDYRVVPIDGFWPRWSGYFAQDTFAQVFGGDVSSVTNPERKATMPQVGIYEYANISGSVNPECLADVKNASEAWTCMLAEKALKYVKSRIFAFEQGWGAWGSFCLVNDVIAFMDPLGWRMQCDPRDGSLHLCVEYGWKCNSDYLRDFVNPYIANANATILAPGVLQRPGNGLFMHSCHIGDEETFISTFETIAVDGVTMKDAFTVWMQGSPSTPSKIHLPCLWNETYTKPFRNCCNPSCPNIPYRLTRSAVSVE